MRVDIKNLVYQRLGAGDFKRFDNIKDPENPPEDAKDVAKKFYEIRQEVVNLIKQNGGKNIKQGSNRYELVFDVTDEAAAKLSSILKSKNIRIMSEYVEKAVEGNFNMALEVKAVNPDNMPPELAKLNLPKGRYFYGWAGKTIPDTQGDLITAEAYQKAAEQITKPPYNKVFLGHEYKDVPIGKVVYAEPREDGLFIVAKLNESHERADEVWKSIQEGYLDGFSLGGKFKRKTPEYDEKAGRWISKVYDLEVREVSLTGVPANPQAAVIQAFQKSLGYDQEKIELARALIADMGEEQKASSPYLNPDGTFKGGFEGCVKHFQHTKGLSEERARALCAYIGRRTGKIKNDEPEVVNLTEEKKENKVEEKKEAPLSLDVVMQRVEQVAKDNEALKQQITEIKNMLEQIVTKTEKTEEKKETETKEQAEKAVEENEPVEGRKSIKTEEKKFAEIEKKQVSFMDWLRS